MNLYSYIGIVRRQALEILLAEDGGTGTCRLSAAAGGAQLDASRIDLAAQDGLVLLVRGIRQDDWIRSAVIVETASELESVVAQAALGRKPVFPKG